MRQKGFTLVEMLIVITIVGMLSILALAGYTEYRKVALLSLTADDLTSTVYQMRDKTIHGDFGSDRVAKILKAAAADEDAGEAGMVDPDAGEAMCYGIYFKKEDGEYVPYSFSQEFSGEKKLVAGEWVYVGCTGGRVKTPLAFDEMVKFLELRNEETMIDGNSFALTFTPPEGKILGENDYLQIKIQYGDNPDDKYKKTIELNYE